MKIFDQIFGMGVALLMVGVLVIGTIGLRDLNDGRVQLVVNQLVSK